MESKPTESLRAPWKVRSIFSVAGSVVLICAGLVGCGLIAILLITKLEPTPSPPIRSIPYALREIARAQETFRAMQLDDMSGHGYWRGDIAGLFTLKLEGQPIKLLDVAIVQADSDPKTDLSSIIGYQRLAVRNYWFRAIRFPEENLSDSTRYAVCAFPDIYREGSKLTFVMSDSKIIYAKDLGHGQGIIAYPRDMDREYWKRLD